jgi:hypothetical protein
MVIIQPTTESGLDSSYTAKLPDLQINLEAPRIVNRARTISGGVVISTWDNDMTGEQRTATQTMTREQCEQLRRLVATGQAEWLIRIRGRIFTAVLSLDSILPIRNRRGVFSVSLSFTFISEVTA